MYWRIFTAAWILCLIVFLFVTACDKDESFNQPQNNNSGSVSIEWAPPQHLAHYNYYGGQLVSVSTYMNFNCTSGSDDLEITAKLYRTDSGNVLVDTVKDTIKVKEGEFWQGHVAARTYVLSFDPIARKYKVVWSASCSSKVKEINIYPAGYFAANISKITWK